MSRLVEKSLAVLEEAFSKFNNLAVAWSGGKDSTVCLFLARKFNENVLVLFNDTTQHFEETYDYVNKLRELWRLNMISVLPSVSYDEVKGDRRTCCHKLKIEPVLNAIRKYKIEAIIAGIRWDEHKTREKEGYFSLRKEPRHYRVHPILHWSEKDIWDFILDNRIPYNPLYDKGFRSIGCMPCTRPVSPSEPERAGRAQDEEEIMRRLRLLGYW